jgi:hypothetical protein
MYDKYQINESIALFHSMLSEPKLSFDYFNRQHIDSHGKPFECKFYQIDYEFGPVISKKSVIASGRSTGKCVSGKSLIKLKDGTYTKIETLVDKNIEIESFNQKTREIEWKKGNVFYNGEKECFNIKFESGYETEVTNEHPFLTDNGWVELQDLKINQNIINIINDKEQHIKILEINSTGIKPTYGIEVNDNHNHIIDGILSHNSYMIGHYVFKWCLTHPGLCCGIIVKNEVHSRGLVKYITDYFNNSEFTSEFFLGYDKKNRTFNLSNGCTIELRIAGADKTGATTLVAGHYNLLIIDEAQLMYATTLPELLPTLKKGGTLIVTGVPNDLRERILYTYCADEDTMYYRYASTESTDWDDEKEKEFLRMYKGGRDSVAWRQLVLALWGDSSTSVFRPSKLADNIREIDFYFNKIDKEKFSDCISELRLPVINNKYDKYIIGSDSGYTERSPMHISVLGCYTTKTKIDDELKLREHYDCVYRLEVSGMLSYEASKLFDYLLNYFNSMYAALDAQNYGANIYGNLINKEIFPETAMRNKKSILPIIFGDAVIVGRVKSIDANTGQEIEVDDKKSIKCATTDKLVELNEKGLFHISDLDQGAADFEDLFDILQCEIQTPSSTNNKLHPVLYTNTKNPHASDSLRCCAYVIMQIIERGIFLASNARPPAKPMRFGQTGSKRRFVSLSQRYKNAR